MTPTTSAILIALLVIFIGIPAAIALVVYLVVPLTKGLVWLVMHVFKFVGRELADALRVIGSTIMGLVLGVLALANIILLRKAAAAHYVRALETETQTLLSALYRVLIGNPARLLMLTALTEGFEQRLPRIFQSVPTDVSLEYASGKFDGYTIVGSLPGGGSGSKLYIAKPSQEKLAAWARSGVSGVDRVVIKSFSLIDGSSLPQIVRENRALPAAKRLGLILEHEVHPDRFFYVTKFVPGETLGEVTSHMHAASGPEGLSNAKMHEAIDYAGDLLRTLHYYHQNGLWHKDVKPDNIVVSQGQAHLVDFGLITPLRSSITLTTHGTEYYRDPEMVRLALRGLRVHEVDGCRFDIYAAGAVLYSVIEGGFPAHGGLSRLSKRCPEALRWVVRRAMADYDKRYESAEAFLADIDAIGSVDDPFSMRPADLPSVKGGSENGRKFETAGLGPDETEVAGPSIGAMKSGRLDSTWAGVSGVDIGEARIASREPTPRLALASWWSGRYGISPDCPRWGSRALRTANMPLGGETAAALAQERERARIAKSEAGERLERFRKSKDGFSLGIVLLAILGLAVVGMVSYAVLEPGLIQAAKVTIPMTGTDEPEHWTNPPAEEPQAAAGEARVRKASEVEAVRVEKFSPIPLVIPAPKSVPQVPDRVPDVPERPGGALRRGASPFQPAPLPPGGQSVFCSTYLQD